MGHGKKYQIGKPALPGNKARQVRESVGLTIPQAVKRIEDMTGHKIGTSGLSKLERRHNIDTEWIARLALVYRRPQSAFLENGNESLSSAAENGHRRPTGEPMEEKVRKLVRHIERLIAVHTEEIVHEAFIRVFTTGEEAAEHPQKGQKTS